MDLLTFHLARHAAAAVNQSFTIESGFGRAGYAFKRAAYLVVAEPE